MNERSQRIIRFMNDGWSPQMAASKAGVRYNQYLGLLKRDPALKQKHDEVIRATITRRRAWL